MAMADSREAEEMFLKPVASPATAHVGRPGNTILLSSDQSVSSVMCSWVHANIKINLVRLAIVTRFLRESL